jgi:hypothetical protein
MTRLSAERLISTAIDRGITAILHESVVSTESHLGFGKALAR